MPLANEGSAHARSSPWALGSTPLSPWARRQRDGKSEAACDLAACFLWPALLVSACDTARHSPAGCGFMHFWQRCGRAMDDRGCNRMGHRRRWCPGPQRSRASRSVSAAAARLSNQRPLPSQPATPATPRPGTRARCVLPTRALQTAASSLLAAVDLSALLALIARVCLRCLLRPRDCAWISAQSLFIL